jgi:hypothetical protein
MTYSSSQSTLRIPVEDDKENKIGQEIFCTTWDTTRNMGENKHRKSTRFAKHLAKVFQPHPSENEPEKEEALTHLLEVPTNSNHQSTALKDQKFRKSSTA